MKVYISYAESDLDAVKEIAAALSKAKHEVWLDYEQAAPGDNLAQKAADGLKQSDAIITIISPDAMKSKFVRADIDYALTAPRMEGRLIPVLVKPTKDVPWILREINLIDATQKPATAAEQIVAALKQPKVASR